MLFIKKSQLTYLHGFTYEYNVQYVRISVIMNILL